MRHTIIGIAGGTASGKTTVAKVLYEKTTPIGSVAMLRMDDYYKDTTNLSLDERRKINFDHPDAYDIDLFMEHLKALKEGKKIEKPVYDFVVSNRMQETEPIEPGNVIIVEGILLFAIPKIRDLFDIKIYVETPDDIRFIRRLTRDIEKRGRSIESVVSQYLSTVRPMHETFVEPSKKYADLIIPEGGHNQVAMDVIITKINQLLNEK